jgi:hypothetical protein
MALEWKNNGLGECSTERLAEMRIFDDVLRITIDTTLEPRQYWERD